MPTSKDMRLLARQAVKAGCHSEKRKNGHTRLTAPNGSWIEIAFSPGSSNNVNFARRKVQKFLDANFGDGVSL